jgi:crotonobetainyl-CoA:carnitine CoA-transferase CaiB-like acyl-CoA transferase
MTNDERPDSLLGPFRVLDLADVRGMLCGKILADLGADVIKVEPPAGDSSRNIPPFYHDIPDPEKSLYWFGLNTNKRGVTLDLETSNGRDTFKKLVSNSDFVIESFSPGHMDSES